MKVTKQLIQCRALDISLIIYSFSLAGAYLSSDFLPFWWIKIVVSLAMMILGSISIIMPYQTAKIAPKALLRPIAFLEKWVVFLLVVMWLIFVYRVCGIF